LDDSAVVAMIRADFAWIASAAELELFDQRHGTDRAQLLWHFFTRRDREELRNNGERLIEHYRRLALGARSYFNADDQRMAVLVRQGEPDSRASLRYPGLRLNESWRYRRPEGDLMVHFQAGEDTTNYRVVSSIFDVTGLGPPGAPAGDDRADEVDRAERILRSRAQLSPFYQAAVAGRRDQLASFRTRERELGSAGRNLALSTDRYPIRFSRDLPLRADILVLGGPSDRAGFTVTYAIPAFALDSGAGPASLRIRAVAWDSLDAAVRAVDTLMPAAAPVRGQIRGGIRLPVSDGHYSVRVVVESGTAGALIGRDGVRIGLPGPEPVLTDLAVGLASDPADSSSDAFLADPRRVFFRTDSIRVTAALAATGFTGGRARLLVRPVRLDNRDDKWRAWPDRDRPEPIGPSVAGWSRVTLTLPLVKIKPGVYDVDLEVADRAEHAVRTRTRITVEDPPR
jgi:hypothetical protein